MSGGKTRCIGIQRPKRFQLPGVRTCAMCPSETPLAAGTRVHHCPAATASAGACRGHADAPPPALACVLPRWQSLPRQQQLTCSVAGMSAERRPAARRLTTHCSMPSKKQLETASGLALKLCTPEAAMSADRRPAAVKLMTGTRRPRWQELGPNSRHARRRGQPRYERLCRWRLLVRSRLEYNSQCHVRRSGFDDHCWAPRGDVAQAAVRAIWSAIELLILPQSSCRHASISCKPCPV